MTHSLIWNENDETVAVQHYDSYYCEHCGKAQSHPVCGMTHVYMPCNHCGGVNAFWLNTENLVNYWEDRIMKLKVMIHGLKRQKDGENRRER